METARDLLFHEYVTSVKNFDHFDKSMFTHIETFTCEQKMEVIRSMNEAIIALKYVVFEEPIKEIT